MTSSKSLYNVGLAVCGLVLMCSWGCSVGPVSPEHGVDAKSTIQSQKLSGERSQTKLLQSPTTKVLRPAKESQLQLTDNKVLADPSPLHPNGRWVGTYMPENGGEYELELFLQVKKTAFLAPTRSQKRGSFGSSWSLIRTAHACGPYAPAETYPLSGFFQIRSPYPAKREETLSGTAESFDAFRYSSTVRIKIGQNLQATARVIRDRNTQKLQLHGTVYEVDADNKFKRVARFLLDKASQ